MRIETLENALLHRVVATCHVWRSKYRLRNDACRRSNIGRVVFAAERVQGGMGLLQDACRDFVLEHLDELEGTPCSL